MTRDRQGGSPVDRKTEIPEDRPTGRLGAMYIGEGRENMHENMRDLWTGRQSLVPDRQM
jgi:hypothetical protein